MSGSRRASRGSSRGIREVTLRLPSWVDGVLREAGSRVKSAQDRMRLAIRLAAENARRRTGGPFGALVCESATGRVIAAGVNRVVPESCSCAHAEVVAISLAQRRLGVYDLGGVPGGCELVTSTEPCAMCLGAVPWSGVRRLVCGARGADACRVGFDEGAKPAAWRSTLRRRGIEVLTDVCRAEARAVLEDYVRQGGVVYNGRR